jgi:hypothetical protein
VGFNSTVLKVLKGGGGDLTGSQLDDGRGRGAAAARLLVVCRSGAAHNGGG